ncbi:FAD/NAD(P)-binding protein [Nocardia brasiliensis]|uniref:FAD/NAD(P)-binding protein n=1 Tax=Nocardia brasiliensis TaxID=37326 RepID=UPI002458A9F4|nr:FAD/NAD(P)-binding protein [Nocardia brasiliensis]
MISPATPEYPRAERPEPVLRIAIVGVGPRGLSVFERICANARAAGESGGIEVLLVDSTRVGTGTVWRTDQSGELLMNTVASQVTVFTDASVAMAGPIEPGPSLYEWASFLDKIGNFAELPENIYARLRTLGPDTYPTRAGYGYYLRWSYEHIRYRYRSVAHAQEITATALDLRDEPSGLQELRLSNGEHLRGLHAVVLTQGHLPLAATNSPEIAHAARTSGLTYFAPANASDVDVDQIPAREPVFVRGLGLTFFDYLTLLTAGRGGCFKQTRGPLEYIPSGSEPLIIAGCRRGVPHHARGENQKGVDGRYEPQLLDARRIAEFRTRAEQSGDLSFRRDVWPLIAREVESVYYTAAIADRVSARELREFRHRYLHAPTAPDAADVLDRFRVPRAQRWDWATIADPTGGRHFDDPADFRSWLLGYLDADVRHAELGNVHGPVKAALDVLRDLRNEVRLIVDYGGITGRSYRDDLDRWYTPLNAFLSIGPPAHRIAELAALIRAGIVRVVGPGMRVRVDPALGCFVADSPSVAGSKTSARTLIDAFLPAPDLPRTGDPLLRNLFQRDEVRSHTVFDPDRDDYPTGGLDVMAGSHAVLDGKGRSHPRRFACGVPTESVRWVTAAGARPGVNSVTLADTDAIARAALGVGR